MGENIAVKNDILKKMVCTVKHLVFCQFDISKNSKDEKKNSVTTEIPLKNDEKCGFFILKVLFVPKIFKFLF